MPRLYGEVDATEARGDDDADTGRVGSWGGRLDPSTDDGFGATPFGSDGTGSHKGTDGHGMLMFESSGGEENGYMDKGTESLRYMALIDCTPEALAKGYTVSEGNPFSDPATTGAQHE